MSTVSLKNSKNFKNEKTSKFDFILKGKKNHKNKGKQHMGKYLDPVK